MDTMRYRLMVRVIACIDLFLSSISVMLILFYFVGTVRYLIINYDPNANPDLTKKSNAEADAKFILFCLIILTSLVIVGFVAATQLLNATQIGMDVGIAKRRVGYWREYEYCLSLTGFFLAFTLKIPFAGLVLFWVFVYDCHRNDMVTKFNFELDEILRLKETTSKNTGVGDSHHPSQTQTQQDQGLQSRLPPYYKDVV